jgi:methyltransferase-like protein/trans-aconitate methyltransferase
MSKESATVNPYDEIPYPSQPLPQTHPDRLATIARLFGMHPERIDRCRVLELGCGIGENLIPMADRHPQSSFVGIDYSQRQIDEGRKAIEALRLANIDLAHLSIMDVDEQLGVFDYIICHGVFSWVAHDVQERILAVCKSHLAPQGVAYVSYNTYPGWHLRGVVREMAWGASSPEQPARERLSRARRLLEFLDAALAEESTAYSKHVKLDVDFVLQQTDDYIFHEYFEEKNYPFYFHEFAARAATHHLQYLGDALLGTMFANNLGPTIEQNLLGISNDTISIEQHMDALRNRCFRHTLMCHEEVSLDRNVALANLDGLYFAGQVQPERASCDLKSTTVEKFVTPDRSAVTSPFPMIKAALYQLGALWPRGLSLDELISSAAACLGTPGHAVPVSFEDRQGVKKNLAQCLAAGLIEAHTEADSFVTTVSARPRASNLARLQAHGSHLVTNRRHDAVALDEVSQNALQHLDGQHDRASLLQILVDAVDRGRLSVFRDGVPLPRGEAVDHILDKTLEQCLLKLAANALLVA